MFKIPKYYVTKISIFSTAFSLPPSKNGVEGLTEDNPLILHQISKVDFKAFLRVLVPLYVHQLFIDIRAHRAPDVYKLPSDKSHLTIRDLVRRYGYRL